ncbi:MAG: 50S ribosomal protein L19 [Chitinispirillaceae bacterium]
MEQIINNVEKEYRGNEWPDFNPGDSVSISIRIQEGDKSRIQPFQGVVIQKRGSGLGKTFTVRKSSGNVYVERVFPEHSPLISEIKVTRRGKVRRSKLYYLRGLTGKATRIKEKK